MVSLTSRILNTLRGMGACSLGPAHAGGAHSSAGAASGIMAGPRVGNADVVSHRALTVWLAETASNEVFQWE